MSAYSHLFYSAVALTLFSLLVLKRCSWPQFVKLCSNLSILFA